MKNGKAGWVEVNLEGLRKILERRGKEVVGYELFQNASERFTFFIASARSVSSRG